VSFCGGADIG
jgi:glycosyltransferase involved in cell wall biosynthesis